MEPLLQFLEAIRQHTGARGQLRGLLHVLIGRQITKADGTPVSSGLTWREAAALMKRLRWDTEAVRDLGLDPSDLPVRDRERFWYAAIARAGVDSAAASAEGDRLARPMQTLGYAIRTQPAKK
jgi:hypothetical protein